jgi:hypothetical protein
MIKVMAETLLGQRSASRGRELDEGPRRPHLYCPPPSVIRRGRLVQRRCAHAPVPRRIPVLPRLIDSEGEHPYAVWGAPTVDHQIWAAHNPYDLAQDLLTTPLFISVGNGQPGPLNRGGMLDRVEEALHAENVTFRARLTQLGAAATFDFYVPATTTGRTGSASCTAPGPS